MHCPQWEFTDAEIFGIVLGAIIAFDMLVIICLRYRARVKRRLKLEKVRHRDLVVALAELEEKKPPSPPPSPRPYDDLRRGYGDGDGDGDGYDDGYDSRSERGSGSRSVSGSGSEEGWSGSDYDDGDDRDGPRYRRKGVGQGRGDGREKRRGGLYEPLPTDQGGDYERDEDLDDYAIDNDMDDSGRDRGRGPPGLRNKPRGRSPRGPGVKVGGRDGKRMADKAALMKGEGGKGQRRRRSQSLGARPAPRARGGRHGRPRGMTPPEAMHRSSGRLPGHGRGPRTSFDDLDEVRHIVVVGFIEVFSIHSD